MALDIMWSQVDQLPDEIPAGPGVRAALGTIRDWLNATESAAVRASLLAWHHLIIRPVTPADLPPAQAMAEITTAIATLDQHGLIIGPDD
jgi:hypothetical protein